MRSVAYIKQVIIVSVFVLSAGNSVAQSSRVSYAAPSPSMTAFVDSRSTERDLPLVDLLQLEDVHENVSLDAYPFRATASDFGGDWSPEPAAMAFSLHSFYESPLVQLICLIALALIILGAFRWRMLHLRAREDELLDLIEMHTKHLREEKEKTECALTEAERARHEAERQKEIAQKSRAIIEKQAEQLREVDRIKTRFFSNVSHEFRTPLTLTIGPLENILAGVYGSLSEQARNQLEIALRNARRLLRLINQLLDLSKLESGRMDLTITRGNVVPLVEGVAMSFTAYAEKKHLGLSFSCEQDEVALCFDPAVLEKVLFNLLSNAVKFTEDGDDVEVWLDEGTVQVGGKAHEAVLIHVKDSGIGIPDEELPYIFDRFHQVDGAIAHSHEGTGIGLSLVKELVELHQGTITVRSEAGMGSEFVVALPKGMAHFSEDILVGNRPDRGMPNVSRGPMMEMAVLSDDEEFYEIPFNDGGGANRDGGGANRDGGSAGGDGRSADPDGELAGGRGWSAGCNSGRQLRPHPDAVTRVAPADGYAWNPHVSEDRSPPASPPKSTILIVDDNPEVVDYVSGALVDEYDVISATNGYDALAIARRHDPNLIISDVMMPNMDGYALCRRLKGDRSLRHIPVILLTARAAQNEKIEGLEAGSDDYISKPFSTRELKARIRNLLTVREQQHQLSNLNAELSEMNDALREASEMKSQLLSIAAHDMKNPLSAIREFARILKSEIGEDSIHYDPLDLIHQSSDQMLHLVSTLLDSAALETGQVVLQKEPLNLILLAAAVVRRNQTMAERKKQTIDVYTPAEPCLVRADKSRILEAMDNLVNNAVKYSPHGRSIRVSVERAAVSIRFSVQDEGPGLSDDDKSKLFRKFQRLSAQPTGGETSTGLGLAIVKQIVEMHDGRVSVQSERGKGSTFTIDLPILSQRES